MCDFYFRTILLSVISLLNEPNTFSPANVDASVMYRRWRDTKGRDKEYENIIRKQVNGNFLSIDFFFLFTFLQKSFNSDNQLKIFWIYEYRVLQKKCLCGNNFSIKMNKKMV